ncbi:MAG: transcriptional regulator [Hyphomonadaceae bacterium]|nr:MAG: transcriptional regulator [Hyphomonadaceae bacterium]KAF0186436.1 MAG: transcriptional regulator [Hyphomonadaceae bacterium]
MTILNSQNGNNKSPLAFRTISEASAEVGVAPHVLRFWEGKFLHLKPLKRRGGRRMYRPQDIAQLLGLKYLLQTQGLTIKGVQKLIKERGIQAVRDIAYENGFNRGVAFDGEIDEAEHDVFMDEIVSEPAGAKAKTSDAAASANGPILRRALARLEQAKILLDATSKK